jgi:Rrf2 family transcriptional regulator, iron-sulfur cluster assembly transcription factor
MKLSSHEEYGFRCLIQLGRRGEGESLTIADISRAEGISQPYVAKLMGILRRAGFVKSVRGKVGGYSLAKPADRIVVGDVLEALGGRLIAKDFCESHSGSEKICANSVDCSVRTLWSTVQRALDQVLGRTTLHDMLRSEEQMRGWVDSRSIGQAPAPVA